MTSIFDKAIEVLETGPAQDKAECAHAVVQSWRDELRDAAPAALSIPERPSRPQEPKLTSPADMPRRRLGSLAGRQALMHAVAHIELNAIDLAFDMIARFAPTIPDNFQTEFINDWLRIGDEEARHFLMIDQRLHQLDIHYGALPAHDGLWEAAMNTQDDVLARLSIAPLVLEARGLDVTPQMIEKLSKVGDDLSVDCLKIIYDEEIGHVAIGSKWLNQLCQIAQKDPKETFQHFVETRFMGLLKEPFNHDAREQAGLMREFYVNITQ